MAAALYRPQRTAVDWVVRLRHTHRGNPVAAVQHWQASMLAPPTAALAAPYAYSESNGHFLIHVSSGSWTVQPYLSGYTSVPPDRTLSVSAKPDRSELPDGNRHARPNVHADADADAHPHAHRDAHAYANRHTDVDAYGDPHANCYTSPDANGDAHANGYADPHTDAHAYSGRRMDGLGTIQVARCWCRRVALR